MLHTLSTLFLKLHPDLAPYVQTPAINPRDEAGQPLSKAQKRFNRLVDNIRTLRSNLDKMAELDLLLRQLGDQKVAPAEEKSMAAFRTLVMALHHNPHFKSLGKRQAEKFDAIMLQELSDLLNTSFYQEDEELRQMFADYQGGEQTFEEIQAEQEQMARQRASEFFNQMFDLDLDAADLDDPEKLREKIVHKEAEFEAAARFRMARQANRKKTPAQLEREAKQAAAAEALKKSVKQIYIDLVQYFHPDKEPDEAKRAAKTETMKQITAAYEADDHLQLLELQMTLLSDRDNIFADFNEVQLTYFNNVLQRQVHELGHELALAHPANNGNIYARFFGPDRRWMERNIGRYLRDLEDQQRQITFTLVMIKTAKGLRAFVNDYDLDPYDDFSDF